MIGRHSLGLTAAACSFAVVRFFGVVADIEAGICVKPSEEKRNQEMGSYSSGKNIAYTAKKSGGFLQLVLFSLELI